MAEITNHPQILDLVLYAGDGFELKLTCIDANEVPINISGEMKAQIRLTRLTEDPPVTEFDVDLADSDQGIIILSLTGNQTQSLITAGKAGKFAGVWDLQWTPNAEEPRTLIQGALGCSVDVTR